VALEVGLDRLPQGKAAIHFAITDTGIGVSPEQASRLFSPFVQADSSTTRKYGGTGLGLAICKQLVEMMGGTIGMESTQGKGSQFYFTAVFQVPVAAVAPPLGDAAAGEKASPSLRPSMADARAGRPFRILVADDNSTNRIVIRAQLERLGCEATIVEDGAGALEALEHGSYDTLLLDWQMPVMDGAETTRRIRRSSHFQIPIVVVTAHAMTGDRERFLEAGADDYLSKPVGLQALAQVLARWTQGSGARRPVKDGEAHAVFNEDLLLERLMQDRELAGKVMKVFLNDCTAQLENLQARLEAGEVTGARLQAHTLQGSAATVSAESLHAVAVELQAELLSGCSDRANELLRRAREEFRLLQDAVELSGLIQECKEIAR
jgi:CheY-like chemotaxis protein/HPt (histidine-containing phosphotransfer) domain-containing protein